MLWFLVIQLASGMSINGDHGPGGISQVGPFKSQAACEAAGKQAQRRLSSIAYVCVPDDVPPKS